MRYQMNQHPANAKDGFINSLKLTGNYVDLADPESLKSAAYMIGKMIAHLENKRIVLEILKAGQAPAVAG